MKQLQLAQALFLAALAALLVDVDAQDSIGCYVPGECKNGFFVRVNQTANANLCLEWCQNTLGCQYFTYYQYENDACYAFGSCPELGFEECQGGENACISGDKECDIYQCSIPGRCHHNVAGAPIATDEYGCSQACQHNVDCEWYTWDFGTNTCFLLKGCDFVDFNCTTCTSSEKECFVQPPEARPDLTKVFVVGGVDAAQDAIIADSEIVDISGDNLNCTDPAPYPYRVEDAVIFNQRNHTTVCGGYIIDGAAPKVTEACYEYVAGSWVFFGNMSTPRRRAAGVTLADGTKWVTGGRNGNNVILNTTEILFPNGTATPGPELPDALEFHCALQATNRHVIIIGGYNYQESHHTETWSYNFVDQIWTKHDDMAQGRAGHVCALVYSDARGIEVVAASGATDVHSVEIFSVGLQNWREGPSVIRDVRYGQGVSLNNNMYALGGVGSDSSTTMIYNATSESWSASSVGVTKANYDFAAILVDEKDVDCNPH